MKRTGKRGKDQEHTNLGNIPTEIDKEAYKFKSVAVEIFLKITLISNSVGIKNKFKKLTRVILNKGFLPMGREGRRFSFMLSFCKYLARENIP
jgi:hypothetical protein